MFFVPTPNSPENFINLFHNLLSIDRQTNYQLTTKTTVRDVSVSVNSFIGRLKAELFRCKLTGHRDWLNCLCETATHAVIRKKVCANTKSLLTYRQTNEQTDVKHFLPMVSMSIILMAKIRTSVHNVVTYNKTIIEFCEWRYFGNALDVTPLNARQKQSAGIINSPLIQLRSIDQCKRGRGRF